MKLIRSSRRSQFVWIMGLLAIAALAQTSTSMSAGAAGMDPSMIPTTGEAAINAKHIVFARVDSVDVRAEAGDVWTYTNFTPLKRIKGNIGNVFTTRLFFVGKFGNAEYIVTDMEIPSFLDGEEVVLFLGEDNQQGFPVVDTENVFRVFRDVNNRVTISPSPDRLPIYSAASGNVQESRADEMTLEDFLFSLSKAIEKSEK